jgi:hypothetical protein
MPLSPPDDSVIGLNQAYSPAKDRTEAIPMKTTRTTQKSDMEVKSAWIVTWEGTSGIPEDRVAAVLNYRMSASSVQDFVELLYASRMYAPREKLLVAKSRKENPYPATMTLSQRIHCGDNPFLEARLVTKLIVVDGALKWTEPPSATERRAKISRQ